MPWFTQSSNALFEYGMSTVGDGWVLMQGMVTAATGDTVTVINPYVNYTARLWTEVEDDTGLAVQPLTHDLADESPDEFRHRQEVMARHREERQRQRVQRERERDERDALREAAQQRAHELLKSILTADQWSFYLEHQSFQVVGSDGYTYRIEHGESGNILKLDSNGIARIRYCAHPDLYRYEDDVRLALPTEDVLVGQVLALRTDAPALLTVANIHRQFDAYGHIVHVDVPQEFDP